MKTRPVYLDYNATTPLAPEVVRAMRPFLTGGYGNPSSAHCFGRASRAAIEDARRRVARLLEAEPGEIIFTSGGTEANNHALKGVAWARRDRGNHLITSAIEHPAILEVCSFLKANGFRVTRVPVDGAGLVDPADVAQAITPGTILISIMHANNEVGTVQPIREIAALARARGILMHTDAAQSVGKIPVSVAELGVDLLSVAGHKLYAPKGVGALYLRAGVTLTKLLHGAGHEGGRRAGTENVLGIVGLGRACTLARRDRARHAARMRRLTGRLLDGLRGVADLRLHGHPDRRLPNTVSVAFRGVNATALLARLRDRVAASAGSACHAGETAVSPVLAAMGITTEWARGTVRFSTGRFTTPREIDTAIAAVAAALSDTL